MRPTLTIEFADLVELQSFLDNIRKPAEITISTTATGALAATVEAVKKTRKAKEASPVQEKVVELVAKQNTEAATSEPPVIDYAAVKKATMDLISKKGKPAALALLTEFGVDAAPKLPEDKWGDFIEAANAEAGRL